MSYPLSRTPVNLVTITLDQCANEFGVAPCTATGTNCYKTFHTCRDRASYALSTVSHDFVTCDTLPFKTGERPYIQSVDYLPTEIKTSFTVSGRVKVKLLDEPDTDVGVDPYVSTRTKPVPGTFFKKLVARNPNYKGRPISIYEGYLGQARGDYQLIWSGYLYNIGISKGVVTIEATDPLKSISDYTLPESVEIKLLGDIGTATTSVGVENSSNASTYTYFRLGDEVISINGRNTALSNAEISRGEMGTTPSSHNDGDKITPIWIRGPEDPFTTMQYLLTFAGISTANIDTAAFTAASTWPATDPTVRCIVTEPTGVEQLYFELVNLTNCKSWYNEEQKITIRRQVINDPTQTYIEITDACHIIEDSASVDLKTQEHITRLNLYWGKVPLGEDGKSTSYDYLSIAMDAEAESSFDYDEVLEDTVYCRWLTSTGMSLEEALDNAKNYAGRQLFTRRDPRPVVSLQIDAKDSTVLTGSLVNIITDELQDVDGDPLEIKAMVIKRDALDNGRISLTCQALPSRSICIMGSSTLASWTAASAADKNYGYMSDSQGVMNDGNTPGYYLW